MSSDEGTGFDGCRACALVEHNELYSDIPVLALSGKDGLLDKARGRVVGSALYLTKPSTGDGLPDAIDRYAARAA